MRKLLMASAATMGALLVTIGGAQAQPVKPVAPGTIAVHLNGYLQFGIGYFGSSANSVTTAGGTAKLNPYTTNGDARLYAGFDAQTLNGIDYGAQIELRTTTSNAGGGRVSTTSTGVNGTTGMYVKRAYGYIGTPEAGFIRLGQTDSAFGLLQTGVTEGYGDGAQFNSDGGLYDAMPGGVTPSTFVYADSSHLYSTDKIVYLSPKIDGFSMGVGFEPSSNGLKEGDASCAVGTTAGVTCAAIASSYVSVGNAARRNTIDAAVQYAGAFDGFATKANVGILNAAPVGYTGAPGTTVGAPPYGLKGMTVYQAGVQTSYAGFTLGANVKWGSVEDSYAFTPKGARNSLDYIVGGTYAIGPYVVGASFIDGQSSGAFVPGHAGVARTLSEYGVAAGGNYVVGKDMSLYLQYEYGHRHQPGVNFTGATTGSGNAQFQVIATGATYKW